MEMGTSVNNGRPAAEFAEDLIASYWTYLLKSGRYKDLKLSYLDIMSVIYDVRDLRKAKPERFLEEIQWFIRLLQAAEKEVKNEL